MQVSEYMHKGVVMAQIDDSLKKVAAIMKREDVGSVPIYKNERPVGFVTDRDIVITCVAGGHKFDDPISHAMSRDIKMVHENDSIDLAAKIMKEEQISRLLVVDAGERPVGILSLKDIVLNADNEEIKSNILSGIKH
jgi:CBS domain-containing protein